MSKENKHSNPLFQSSNLDFTPNALFMPVQDQNSPAIFTAESDPAEEASFIGQNPSFSQEQQNVATFTMFSQQNNQNIDPFSNLTSTSSVQSSSPAIFASEQQEPPLVVPPTQTVVESSIPLVSPSTTSIYSSESSSVPFQPPVYSQTPPLLQNNGHSTPVFNPYARSAAGGKPRPMFPSNSQLYQTPSTSATNLNNFPPGPPKPSQSEPSIHGTMPPSFENLANSPTPPTGRSQYQNLLPHWFFCKKLSDGNLIWCPFSYLDSNNLETAHNNNEKSAPGQNVISTDGGRYDVCVDERERRSIYWEEEASMVRRASWFCKSDTENRYSPYEEDIAEKLEMEYRNVVSNGLWHKRIELKNGEVVVVHSPQLIVHFQPVASKDEFGGVFETQLHSKVVKRGISGTEFEKEIPPSEIGTPDHVVFLCHGIGPVCDLRSRSIVECVDDFRLIHLNLLQSHFKKGLESGKAHRIEFLPVHWHRALHGDATGIDRNVLALTLPSISRLRHFTNETLLDILFYSSPVYCQTIADTVGNEINSLYKLFISRNPTFKGEVSLSGHSLGSLILFDLLCHQTKENAESSDQTKPDTNNLQVDGELSCADQESLKLSSSSHSLNDFGEESLEDLLNRLNLSAFLDKFEAEQIDIDALLMCSESDLKDIGIPMGPRKKLIGFLKEQKEKEAARKEMELKLDVENKFKLQLGGAQAPINVVEPKQLPVDQIESFASFLSTATNVHVDFQQFDAGTGQPLVHYPQLDFHPKFLFALGSPIGVFLTVRGISELGEDFSLPTCPGFLNIFHPFDPVAYRIEPLINPDFNLKPVLVPHYKGRKRMHLELKESLGRMGHEIKQSIMRSVKLAVGSMQRFAQSHWNQAQKSTEDEVEQEVKSMTEQIFLREQEKSSDIDDLASITSEVPHAELGGLNGGKRIDFVLQERPLESFNDYLFAFQSHLCYWNNEDTVLLVMKELFGSTGVLSDRQIEKQNLIPASLPSPTGQPAMSTIPLK